AGPLLNVNHFRQRWHAGTATHLFPRIIQIARSLLFYLLEVVRPGRFELPTLCFASTSRRSNDSIPLLRFLMFLTTSGNLLLARSKDRKSTRLNSSHLGISYAVFCLKKKKK